MATVTSFLSEILFHNTRRTITFKDHATVILGTGCIPSRLARTPSEIGEPAKVNSLAYYIHYLENGDIKMAMEDTGAKKIYFVILKTVKSIITVEGNTFTVQHNASEENQRYLKASVIAVLLNEKIKEMSNFQNDFEVEKASLSSWSAVFDSFYYNLKHITPAITGDLRAEEEEVKTAFEIRSSAFRKLVEIPKMLRLDPAVKYYGAISETAPSEAETVAEEDSEMDLFAKKCREGFFRKFASRFIDAMDRIPNLDILKTFKFNETFQDILEPVFNQLNLAAGFAGEDKVDYAEDLSLRPINLYLYGPPGTGKSYLTTALSAALGVPLYQLTASGNFEEGSFNKMPTFNDEGKISMEVQTFRRGFERGGIICMDEANLAKPDVMMALAGALERPYTLGMGKENVRRHAMCVIVATANPATAGTKDQNIALINRFKCVKLPQMEENELKETLLTMRSNKANVLSAKDLDLIMKVYRHMVNGCKNNEDLNQFSEILSLRSLATVAEDYCDRGVRLSTAIEQSIISPITFAVSGVRGGIGTGLLEDYEKEVEGPAMAMLTTKEYKKKYERGKS